MTVCYIGLGSNIGDRKVYLRQALRSIDRLPGTRVEQVSRIIETVPVGGPAGQCAYLNAVARVRTTLKAYDLMESLLAIEKGMGRVRNVRNGPRVIDLDLLLYSYQIYRMRRLTVPHPRMFKRMFVLQPLAEVIKS